MSRIKLHLLMAATLLCTLVGKPAAAQSMADARLSAPDTFPADVYASKSTAIDRLVARTIAELHADPTFKPNDFAFQVSATGASSEELNRSLIAPLNAAFAGANVIESAHPKPADRTIAITLNVTDHNANVSIVGGGKLAPRTFTARYVLKPWADDWSLFRNGNHAKQKRWLLATSSSFGATEQDAILSAQQAAVEQLAPLMADTIRASAARSGGTKVAVTQTWIRERLVSSITRNVDNALVADSFVQKFERPYGDVWQASLLIDASQEKMSTLADGYNISARAQSRAETTTWGATAGVIAVVGLLYAFLNTVTKGYFLWRLRAVALLAAIAGAVVMFAHV